MNHETAALTVVERVEKTLQTLTSGSPHAVARQVNPSRCELIGRFGVYFRFIESYVRGRT